MRIGILGGTFNPVHNGHLYIADKAFKKLHLDKVIFVPAYVSPHKKKPVGTRPLDRLEMLRLVIGSDGRFDVSAYELKKRSTSYSIDTVRFLKKKYGKNSKLFFIIGADSVRGLRKWREIRSILKLARFVAFSRTEKDVSSTDIRERLRHNRPIKALVPGEVSAYIEKKGLYRK